MKYVTIPDSSLSLSCLCFGAGPVGSIIDSQNSFALLDTYAEMGGNFIDTAKIYADWLPGEKSISEKTIGRWLADRKNRASMIIATKGGHPELAVMHIPRLSRAEIVSDLDSSLKNLCTDHIDIYWLHRDDPNKPVGEIIETLASQVTAGKIAFYGCSNWQPDRIRDAQIYAWENKLPGFIANQVMWNLAAAGANAMPDPTMASMDIKMLEYHRRTNLAAVLYSSQANGFFHHMEHGSLSRMSEGFRKVYDTASNANRFNRATELAKNKGVTLTSIVLGYVLCRPFPTIAIIGSRTIEQLRDSMHSSDVCLSAEEIEFLDG